jgi:hypothetical protein
MKGERRGKAKKVMEKGKTNKQTSKKNKANKQKTMSKV